MPTASPPLLRLHFLVQGRVQGVGFRHATNEKATQLGVAGWVRNLPDGKVEVWAEGPQELVESLYEWCRRGPLFAKVLEVTVQHREVLTEMTAVGFEIHG